MGLTVAPAAPPMSPEDEALLAHIMSSGGMGQLQAPAPTTAPLGPEPGLLPPGQFMRAPQAPASPPPGGPMDLGAMASASPPPASRMAPASPPPAPASAPPAGVSPAQPAGAVPAMKGLFADKEEILARLGDMFDGWAMGAGGTWQDSLAAGGKAVAVGKLTRKEKKELAASDNKTREWAIANGVDPATADTFIAAKQGGALINYVEQQKKAAAEAQQPQYMETGGGLILDKRDPTKVVADYRSAGDKLPAEMQGYELAKSEGFQGTFLDYKKATKEGGVNITNEMGGGTDKQIFDTLNESATAARAAVTGLNGLREAKAALNAGIISGAGADARLQLQKIGSLLGVADPAVIQNTETFRAAIAPQVAAMMKATVGSTQISNADREFAEKAAGGSINLDAGSISKLVDIMERAGTAAVQMHQQKLDAVYPESGGFVRERALFGVQAPQMATQPPAAGAQPSREQLLEEARKRGLVP
jgi:hypothetical protein